MTEAYNIDCMEAMREMKDNQFDLAIVDPPYGIGDFTKVGDPNIYKKRADKKYGKVEWNNEIPSEEYFIELHRISKEQIIWGANYYWQFIPSKNFITWYKMNDSSRWSKCEIASTSIGINQLIKLEWNGFIRCEKVDRIHSCQKPVALYKWLLKNYTKEGDRILDTHLGSGSSRIAAHDMGFDFVGYEIDKDYFNAQEKRFQNHIQQQSLFESKEMYS